MLKSASSGQDISTRLKLNEGIFQFQRLIRDRSPWRPRDFSALHEEFERYNALVKAHAGIHLANARTLEIGSGQRPYRLLYLFASGVDAYGLDLDKVIESLSITDVANMYRTNGLERSIKTVLRYAIFDRAENEHLNRFLSERAGSNFKWPRDRIMHGCASNPSIWPPGKFDFVFSEDVFEHISVDVLEKVCANISQRLSDGGIASIRPMIFTGLQGGHNVEWYDVSTGRERRCPPWDHLRKQLYPANTYLNKLRLADYRSLFEKHFNIIEEKCDQPSLGIEYMTAEIRLELNDYSDEELFSNHVNFVLSKKL